MSLVLTLWANHVVAFGVVLSGVALFFGIAGAVVNAVLHRRTPDALRSRAVSFFSLVFQLGSMIASILLGYLVSQWGVQAVWCGVGVLVAVAVAAAAAAGYGASIGGWASGPVEEAKAAAHVYVFVKELDTIVDPKPLDTVVVLKQPYPVKAGDVIGQLGHYLRYPDAKLLPAKPTRPLLHLEVFAGPELEAFIQKSRERAKQLPASKAFLEISPGARLVNDLPEPDQKLQPGVKLVPLAAAQGKWVKVQPKTAAPVHGSRHAKPVYNDAGTPVWVDSSLANTTATAIVPAWKSFPLSFSNAQGPGADFRDVFRSVEFEKNSAGSVAKDDKGRCWQHVKIGAKDGGTRDGWVCEQDHPLVRMCGPWDWPGFELVDNSSIKPVDMLKRYIHVAEQFLADEDKTEFETSAATVNASPLISKLEKAIDANHDGNAAVGDLVQSSSVDGTPRLYPARRS